MDYNKDLISCIKGYFILNDVVKLASVSKLWHSTLSYSPILVMTDTNDEKFVKAIKHISKSSIKYIDVNINTFSKKSILSKKVIDDFFMNISKAGAKLHSINFNDSANSDCEGLYLYKYNRITNIGHTEILSKA